MVLRVIEILKYFQPNSWFIENPRALMKWFPPLQQFITETGANMNLVYYGNYNWGFPKPTNIWSNLPLWANETVPEMPTDSYTIKYHNSRGKNIRYYKAFNNANAEKRSKIPPELIERLHALIPK